MIRLISAETCVAIRWPILREGLPRESAVFDGDERADSLHFGAFQNENLVGVVTLHAVPAPGHEGPAWQLRGMATLPSVRGAGYGASLLNACEAAVRERGGGWLWCNARTPAVPFYERHGWVTEGAEFDIPTAGPHYRMLRHVEG